MLERIVYSHLTLFFSVKARSDGAMIMCERVTRLELTALKKVKRYANVAEEFHTHTHTHTHIVEPSYNDIGFYDTSPITSDILRYQLIPHC